MNKKTISGTIAGGVASFLAGWLIYGLILTKIMGPYEDNGIMRKEGEMVWWALIASNLVWAYFLTWIMQIRNASGLMGGLTNGAIVGLITTISFDLGMYSMSNFFSDFNKVIVDIAASTVLGAITGAVIGLVIGDKQEAKESDKS